MILLFEIILTIVVWNSGWRWKSLIPIGITFIMGIFLASISLSTGNTLNPSSVVIWDLLAIIALIVMCFVKPNKKEM